MSGEKNILITGANGQLGSSFRALQHDFPGYNFLFVSRNELTLSDKDAIDDYFLKNRIFACINCAAYTAVDRAEEEKELAFESNATAAGYLAAVCGKFAASFIHISTDYVFPGNGTVPYREDDDPHPINVYAASKLEGERLVLANNHNSMIIRTSWVFSAYGKNFVRTMVKLMEEKEAIAVVADQLGCPTYAGDLAGVIMQIVTKHNFIPGIYHYCNQGVTSWFDFATAIKHLINSPCQVDPITTASYPTPAMRPHYSALDTNKISGAFGVAIPHWRESLAKCLLLLKN